METDNKTETKKVKLIFRTGRYKNDTTGAEKDVFISKLDGKIVYADIKLALRTGVSYNCEIALTPQGKAYDVVSAVKTPVIKANLVFKNGKKKYNEKTNDFMENMVSTFDGEIAIASKALNIEPHKEYACEIVLSPQGKAYIVEVAELASPAKAEIVAHEAPLSVVEVIIDGVKQDDLKFDCMAGDEKMLQAKMNILRQKSIADNFFVVADYELTCRNLMQKHLSKIQ